MLYDKIAQFDDFAQKIWNEEEDERVTSTYFYDIWFMSYLKLFHLSRQMCMLYHIQCTVF